MKLYKIVNCIDIPNIVNRDDNMDGSKDYLSKRTGTKTIKTPRLVLRKILPTDFFSAVKWYRDPELYRFSRSHNPPSVMQTLRFTVGRLRKYGNKSYYYWAVVYKRKMRGFVEITESKKRENYFLVHYKLDISLNNQGITTEALTAVIEYLKTQGAYYLIGYCDVKNIGSKRVMEKAGMESFGSPETNPKFHYEDGTMGDLYSFRIKLNDKPQ